MRGDPEVSEKTRARISKLVDELGYVPNYAARALAAKRTNVLQVVLAAPMFHGHGTVLLSILNASAQAGYHVSLSYAYGADGQLRNDFTPFDVDGVIILGGQDPTIDVAIESGKRFPTVLMLTSEKGLDGISTVAVDNVRGARLAAEHLLAQGLTDVDPHLRVRPAGRTRRCADSATSRRARPTASNPSSFSPTRGTRATATT